MKRLIRKFFPSKAGTVGGKPRTGKSGRKPMILSFDGRVVRLHLPN